MPPDGDKAEQLISSLPKTENVGGVLFSGRPEKRLQLIIRTQKNGLFLAFPFSGRGSVTRKPGVFSGCDGPSPENSMGCLAAAWPLSTFFFRFYILFRSDFQRFSAGI